MGCRTWEIDTEITELEEVLSWSIDNHSVDHLLVAVRTEKTRKGKRVLMYPEIANRTKKLFDQKTLRDSFYASGWPGTKLTGGIGLILVFRFTEKIKKAILKIEPCLSNWLHENGLPEDICIFRQGDRYPVLVSVTHEDEAWLISNKRVDINGISFEDDDDTELGQFIFDGPYFCETRGASPSSRLNI